MIKTDSLLARLVFPFITYVFLFVGTGFISGAVVHSGDVEALYRYWMIGVVGVFLFVLGSYVQEVIYNKKNLKEEGVIPFLSYSLLLSVGIGMISGGTQHFADFPYYASALIPIGIWIALVAFALKNNISLSQSEWASTMVSTIVFASILWLGLNSFAATLPATNMHGHGMMGTPQAADPVSVQRNMQPNGHSMTVENDADFLMGMIPHHQEAVDTSAYVLTRTSDPELQTFLKAVIDVQTKEIDQMKQWHLVWFATEYQDDGSYMPMMGNLSSLKNKELEKAYIEGMISHHKGAVDMAQQILEKTSRAEIKTMAQAIITTQTQEITLLEKWLQTKYEGVPSQNNQNMMQDASQMMKHDDGGMMHH